MCIRDRDSAAEGRQHLMRGNEGIESVSPSQAWSPKRSARTNYCRCRVRTREPIGVSDVKGGASRPTTGLPSSHQFSGDLRQRCLLIISGLLVAGRAQKGQRESASWQPIRKVSTTLSHSPLSCSTPLPNTTEYLSLIHI